MTFGDKVLRRGRKDRPFDTSTSSAQAGSGSNFLIKKFDFY
jgi:hypothetical protein